MIESDILLMRDGSPASHILHNIPIGYRKVMAKFYACFFSCQSQGIVKEGVNRWVKNAFKELLMQLSLEKLSRGKLKVSG